jgi:uncharacterized membrane protein YiaA
MIIEYRTTAYRAELQYSSVLRTYKDVYEVHQKGAVTYLIGLVPAKMDLSNPGYPKYTEYAKSFLIAAIHLGTGEYLEVVDVPRD